MTQGAELDDLKIQGPLRRNAPLLAGVIIVLIVGPALSRMLESYRGVVLEVRGDEMLIGLENKPPKWIGVIDAEPGAIIQKERLAWSPGIAPQQAADYQLLRLHHRYSRAYTGVVIRISPPKTPQGASTALVQLADGQKLNVPLWGEHLATVQVGSRLTKTPGSWEPVLDGDGVVDLAAPPEAISGTPAPAAPSAPVPAAPKNR